MPCKKYRNKSAAEAIAHMKKDTAKSASASSCKQNGRRSPCRSVPHPIVRAQTRRLFCRGVGRNRAPARRAEVYVYDLAVQEIRTLNKVFGSSGSVHRAWKRCRWLVPHWHAHGSMER